MKAYTNGKEPNKPKDLNEVAVEINELYRNAMIKHIQLSVLKGGNAVFKIIGKEYVLSILAETDKDKQVEKIEELLIYLKKGYDNAIKYDTENAEEK